MRRLPPTAHVFAIGPGCGAFVGAHVEAVDVFPCLDHPGDDMLYVLAQRRDLTSPRMWRREARHVFGQWLRSHHLTPLTPAARRMYYETVRTVPGVRENDWRPSPLPSSWVDP
jgi:hypothetical protein